MEHRNMSWLRGGIIVLVIEKIIQHIAVTAALSWNWSDIRSTVAVPPGILIVLGGIVAVLFAVALWGLIRRRGWAVSLVMALAVFDMLGEFAAQGTIGIQLNVSFLVATALLILCLVERRGARQPGRAVG